MNYFCGMQGFVWKEMMSKFSTFFSRMWIYYSTHEGLSVGVDELKGFIVLFL